MRNHPTEKHEERVRSKDPSTEVNSHSNLKSSNHTQRRPQTQEKKKQEKKKFTADILATIPNN